MLRAGPAPPWRGPQTDGTRTGGRRTGANVYIFCIKISVDYFFCNIPNYRAVPVRVVLRYVQLESEDSPLVGAGADEQDAEPA